MFTSLDRVNLPSNIIMHQQCVYLMMLKFNFCRFLVVLPENSLCAHLLDYSQFPVDKKSLNTFSGKLKGANAILAHDLFIKVNIV